MVQPVFSSQGHKREIVHKTRPLQGLRGGRQGLMYAVDVAQNSADLPIKPQRDRIIRLCQ